VGREKETLEKRKMVLTFRKLEKKLSFGYLLVAGRGREFDEELLYLIFPVPERKCRLEGGRR